MKRCIIRNIGVINIENIFKNFNVITRGFAAHTQIQIMTSIIRKYYKL
jgi:hypothetical protein